MAHEHSPLNSKSALTFARGDSVHVGDDPGRHVVPASTAVRLQLLKGDAEVRPLLELEFRQIQLLWLDSQHSEQGIHFGL